MENPECKATIWREELWQKYCELAENTNPNGLTPAHVEALTVLTQNEVPPVSLLVPGVGRGLGLAFLLGYVLALDSIGPSEKCSCEK